MARAALLWALASGSVCAWVSFPKAGRRTGQFHCPEPKCRFTSLLLSEAAAAHTGQIATSGAVATEGTLIGSAAIPRSELSMLRGLIQSCTPVSIVTSDEGVSIPEDEVAPGATGRVAIVKLAPCSLGDGDTQEWQSIVCEEVFEILASEDDDSISEPILLQFMEEKDSGDSSAVDLAKVLNAEIDDCFLAQPVQVMHEHDGNVVLEEQRFVPCRRYEVDGAMVEDSQEETLWDTSSVLVFDDLVSPDLRARMRKVLLGSDGDWDDANGPDPSRWVAGALSDLPDDDEYFEEGEECEEGEEAASYGLTDAALLEICEDQPPPPAFEEMEKLLVELFPHFTVTKLPEAVLGPGVSPITANAPCFGQSFSDHIDADPYFAPPSAWTDVYGIYGNRAKGKPRFVSCLVYLNDEWSSSEWGAPTRFWDVATETAVDIDPKPGRVVIMDSDITHSVVAPLEAAGKRPRYSLVWKLILHPKVHQQDMRQLCGTHQGWPEPICIGSANQ